MAIAPSEKHLEDWIVEYYLKDDEDPQFVVRQFQLPTGIADVIEQEHNSNLIVYELKQGEIDAKALAQILRYLRDIREIAKLSLAMVRDPGDFQLVTLDPEVKGVLIGHTLKDKRLLIAAALANVKVMTYDYDPEDDGYDFQEHEEPKADLETYVDFAFGKLGKAIQENYVNYILDNADHLENFHMLEMMRIYAPVYMLRKSRGFIPLWEKGE